MTENNDRHNEEKHAAFSTFLVFGSVAAILFSLGLSYATKPWAGLFSSGIWFGLLAAKAYSDSRKAQ